MDRFLKKALAILFLLACSSGAWAQDLDLANEYYSRQEWEKALSLYAKLAKDDAQLEAIHAQYLGCMMQLKDYKAAQKYLKKLLKEYPLHPRYRTDYVLLLRAEGNEQGVQEEMQGYLELIKRDGPRLKVLGVYLLDASLFELVEETYRVGERNQADDFYMEQADLYHRWGKKELMMQAYLNRLRASRQETWADEVLEEVQGSLQERLSSPEDFAMLEAQLYQYLQKHPEQLSYNRLLVWMYLQQKEFFKAFTQAKAVDRRLRAEGREIMEIGMLCFDNEAFADAVKVFGYLVEKYPNSGFVYMQARNMLVKSKEEMVRRSYPVDPAAIASLVADYQASIADFGVQANTAEAVQRLARLQAFYQGRHEEAVALLQSVISQPRMPVKQVDAAKLDLGDVYVLKQEPWEAALLYAQVEKSQKDKELGHEAKLRSAKLSYYTGDFKLAKAHLDVLKLATSREIANDAMQLSLLIQDNLELDTSATALKEYAQIELLVFQGIYTVALERYAELLRRFPKHTLADEILWGQANLLVKLGKTEEAVEALELLRKDHGDDLWGDDATFLVGKLYEEAMQEKDLAQQRYTELLTAYPGSIYVSEARKRARKLRGDKQ